MLRSVRCRYVGVCGLYLVVVLPAVCGLGFLWVCCFHHRRCQLVCRLHPRWECTLTRIQKHIDRFTTGAGVSDYTYHDLQTGAFMSSTEFAHGKYRRNVGSLQTYRHEVSTA